jgi:hypothetical protein
VLSCRELLPKNEQDLRRVVRTASQNIILHESEVLLNSTYILIQVDFILFPVTIIYSVIWTSNTTWDTHVYTILKSTISRAPLHATNGVSVSCWTYRPHSRTAPVPDPAAWLWGALSLALSFPTFREILFPSSSDSSILIPEAACEDSVSYRRNDSPEDTTFRQVMQFALCSIRTLHAFSAERKFLRSTCFCLTCGAALFDGTKTRLNLKES